MGRRCWLTRLRTSTRPSQGRVCRSLGGTWGPLDFHEAPGQWTWYYYLEEVLLPGQGTIIWTMYCYLDKVLLPGQGTIIWTRYCYLHKVLLPGQGTITWTRYSRVSPLIQGFFRIIKFSPQFWTFTCFSTFPPFHVNMAPGDLQNIIWWLQFFYFYKSQFIMDL